MTSPILRENLSHLNVFTSPTSQPNFLPSKDKENLHQILQKSHKNFKNGENYSKQVEMQEPQSQLIEDPLSYQPQDQAYDETPLQDIEISEIKKKLLTIFTFYSSFGDRKNLKLLKSNKFHKMMSDSGLKDCNLSQKRLDLLFMAESQHRSHLDFNSFLKLLVKVACFKYPYDESQALKRILFENFEPLYHCILQETDLGYDKLQFAQEVSLEILMEVAQTLMKIYLAYFPWEPKSFQTAVEISKRSESSLFIFLRDFEICPSILTKSKTYLLYNEVITMSKEDIARYYNQSEDIGTCFTFSRFLIFLSRVALTLANTNMNTNNNNSTPLITHETLIRGLLERMELSSGFMNLEKRISIPFNSKLTLRLSSSQSIDRNMLASQGTQQISKEENSEIMEGKDGDYEEGLKKIFGYYCALGEPLNSKYLKSIKLKRFLKEAGVEKIEHNYLDLLFVKLKGKTGKMEYNGFTKALELISKKLRPDLDKKTAFQWLFETFLQDFSDKVSQCKRDPEGKSENYVQLLMDLLQDSEILDLLGTVHKSLRFYYEAYTNNNGLMTFECFAKFAKDFDIFPTILTKAKLLKIFETLAGVFQRTAGGKFDHIIADLNVIDQHLFIEGLALCAFEVNYEEPEPNNFEKVYYLLEKLNQSEGVGAIQRKKGVGMKAQNWDLLQEYRKKTITSNGNMSINRSRSSGLSGISNSVYAKGEKGLDFETLLKR